MPPTARPITSETNDFQTLLAEAGIEFRSSPDFVPCPVRENSVFRYQYAERKVVVAGMEMQISR